MKRDIFFKCAMSKKGNFSVVGVMLFAAMIMFVFIVVKCSAIVSDTSYNDAVMQSAGRSVLSEYHVGLKDTYGIFAFKSYERETESKLRFYIEDCLKGRKNSNFVSCIIPELNSVNLQMQEYSLENDNVFVEAITEASKYPKLFEKEFYGKADSSEGRLINERVISELPSKTEAGDVSNMNVCSIVGFSGDESFKEQLGKKIIVNYFIMNRLNCNKENRERISTFFQNEIEYVLFGHYSDEENQDGFEWRFKVLRNCLNVLHICSQPDKLEQIETTAAMLTPGPEAAITAVILTEGWALMEAENDAKLLMAGESVALIKNKNNWAISLSSVANSIMKGGKNMSGGYITPVDTSGLSYKEYLGLFLTMTPTETKIKRCKDIIQLNVQGAFDDTFLIKNCYTGLLYGANINGREYQYVQKY